METTRADRSVAPCWNRRLAKTGMSSPVTALDPGSDDLALEIIEPVVVPSGQLDERNRLGHRDHAGQTNGLKPMNPVSASGRVGPRVAAALAAANRSASA